MKHLLLTTVLLIASLGALQAQTTYYVKADGTGDGSSWANASGDLQNIINTAVSGDNIFVAGGTYQPATSGTSFTMKEGVKIYGGFAGTESSLAGRNLNAGNISILKGNGSSVIYNLQNGLTTAAVLDGFTITGGNASNGGGMFNYSASPTVTNIIFDNNTASGGGGMWNYLSSPALTNVTFDNNEGDGMYNSSSSPTLNNVDFTNNIDSYGAAGMFNSGGSAVLNHVNFINNNGGNSNQGGAMYNKEATITITDAIFANNTAGDGAGMLNVTLSSSTLTDVAFVNNSASNGGGGIENLASSLTLTNVTLANNTAGSNQGGAIYNNISSIYHFLISNTIFWGNTAGTGADIYNFTGSSAPTVSNSYTQTAIAGTGNVQGSSDPFLDDADPAGADGIYMTADDGLNISASSAAYNSGDNNSIPTGISTDITGAPRIANVIVDMGAYENQNGTLPLTLLNFTAAKQNNSAQLKWQTTNEMNTSYFNIQRSTDAVHFNNIGVVNAANQKGVNDYSYADNIEGISASILYYRLQEVDIDGHITYSKIVIINPDETTAGYTIYPNPAKDYFNLISSSSEDLKGAVMSIVDLSGQVLLKRSLLPAVNQKISISSLAKGMYILKIEKITGVVTRKLLKE